MSRQEFVWGEPGPCPSCGVVTEHTWFRRTRAEYLHPVTGEFDDADMEGSQGVLFVSRCASVNCRALAVWTRGRNQKAHKLVYPQAGIRVPPDDGLKDEETSLYREAAAVALVSPRAACALLRALLEAYLKRHLVDAGHPVGDKRLVEIIDSAVSHLELSQTLKRGLTAIRGRGNTAVHDPYGLTDDARARDLPWLFQAVDDLVEDLHVKPQKWADIAKR